MLSMAHSNDTTLYQHIMRQDDELREQCEIKIGNKYAGKVAYSDIIGRDRKEIQLWNLITARLHDR
jgi:hypothetical protein